MTSVARVSNDHPKTSCAQLQWSSNVRLRRRPPGSPWGRRSSKTWGYIYIYIIMPNISWICMDMYGYVWICMDMYGYVWICMDMYGYVWICMDMYGYVWICIHRAHTYGSGNHHPTINKITMILCVFVGISPDPKHLKYLRVFQLK